jgi:phosphoserine phosphatase RsbU/P
VRSVVGTCHPGLTPRQVIDRVCEAAGVGEDNALPDDTTVVCVDRRTGSGSRARRERSIDQGSPPLLAAPDMADAAAVGEVRQPCSEV